MASLDRAVSNPQWSADGQNISFLIQDDRTQHLARVPAESPSGTPTRLTNGRRSVRAPSAGKDGNFAVLATAPKCTDFSSSRRGTLPDASTQPSSTFTADRTARTNTPSASIASGLRPTA